MLNVGFSTEPEQTPRRLFRSTANGLFLPVAQGWRRDLAFSTKSGQAWPVRRELGTKLAHGGLPDQFVNFLARHFLCGAGNDVIHVSPFSLVNSP